MLQSLQIKNVALIRDLSLAFEQGFSVLIGETGAGKSIILDSLNFVLGGKADKTLIRTGEKNMRVEALFTCINQNAKEVLQEQGIELENDEVILSRTLNTEGRSECRINGFIVLVGTLKQLALNLVDSYAQHDSIILLSAKKHQAVLDSVDSLLLEPIKKELEELLFQKQKVVAKINEINGEGFSFEAKKDFLMFQVNEIETINPLANEDEELHEKRQMLMHYEKNAELIKNLIQTLEGDGSGLLSAKTKMAHKQIALLALQHKNFEEVAARMENVALELADIYETIVDFSDNYVFDERELSRIDARYDKIKMLKQKYGPTLDDVLAFYQTAKQKLYDLENSEYLLGQLEKEKQQIKEKILLVAKNLSDKRKQIASKIEKQMQEQLFDLGMKHAIFQVSFSKNQTLPEEIGKNGIDEIEFLFSANKGEELKSLSKTISGGELSRFMLAFKNILVGEDSVQLLVFDEIDSGISGETASVVAQKLGSLSKHFQILCITHLPQVASMADHYYFVKKMVEGNATFTKVELLSKEREIQEIARLTGVTLSDNALRHAKDLKEWSNQFKSK